MFHSKIHFKITYWLLAVAMATMPFTIYFMLPIAILLILNMILEWNWKARWARIQENGFQKYFWIFLAYYFVYCLGLLYTKNWSYGASVMEHKLWFLITPFLILTLDKQYFTWKYRNRLVFIFIMATFGMTLTNLTLSTLEYAQSDNIFVFFYEKATHIPFSNPMHPTYLSMYITFSFIAALYYLNFSPIELKKWKRILLGVSLPVLFIFNYLLQSKAGLIVFIVMLLISTLYLLNRIKIQLLKSFLFVILLGALVVASIKIGSETMSRMKELMKDISRNGQVDDGQWHASESGSERMIVWKIGAQQSLKHLPLGVGTGDAKDIMVQQYKEQGFESLYHDQLNPHNQYLQTLLTLGILGIVIILLYFSYPLYKTWKEKKLLFLAFLCIVMPNLLTESMLERGAGANFVALFMCILAYDAFLKDEGRRTKD